MYAIIETGGKQYRVEAGQIIEIERLEAESGKITFDRVLLCSDGKSVTVGTPTVAKASVAGEVLDEIKGDKVISFKKRRRKDSRWKKGHRQTLARVRIDEITVG